MTDSSEVKISDACLDFIEAEFAKRGYLMRRQQLKDTADVFATEIARRVPGKREHDPEHSGEYWQECKGHNACRARVLEGPEG
jgi:hypothetical protein